MISDTNNMTLVGNFRIAEGKELGKGTGGKTFRATHKDNGTVVVAAKQVYLGEDSDWKQTVEDAVSAQRDLPSHENIVKFIGYEVDKKAKNLWIFTELCSFGDLDSYCRRNATQQHTRFDLMHQVSKAVHHLHNQDPPIVHRDIKSTNILLTIDKGQVTAKLCDFMLAIEETAEQFKKFCGTPSHLAPEFFQYFINKDGVFYDKTVDIFSCGMFFWAFLIAGDYEAIQPPKCKYYGKCEMLTGYLLYE